MAGVATRSRLRGGLCPAAARYARTRRTRGPAATSPARSPVRMQPASQQRPEPLHRVDMDLAEPIPVVVPGELPRRMADRPVGVAPLGEPMGDVILVRVDRAPRGDRRLDERADRLLLDVGQHPDDDLSGPLDHPKDRRLLLRQRPPAPLAPQPPASSRSPFFLTASGWPLWPATTYTSSHSTSPESFTSGFR